MALADGLVRGVFAHAGLLVFASVLAVPIAGAPGAGATAIGIGSQAARDGPRVLRASSTVVPPAELAADRPVTDPAPPERPASGTPGEIPPASDPLVAAHAVVAARGARAHGDVVLASWYGPGFYGNRLPCWQWLQANGLPIALSAETWGVAHRTLPCGTPIELSHAGRTVTVPVVDRGPYVGGRTLDLTAAVRSALGCPGLCTLLMHVGE